MKISLAAIALAGWTAAAVAQVPATASDSARLVSVDRIVAVVGTEPILWSEVVDAISLQRAGGQQIPQDSAAFIVYARKIVEQLVNAELLVQKAKELKLEATDAEVTAEVDRRLAEVRARYPSEAEFRADLRGSSFGTPEEYRKWLLDQQRRSALQEKAIQKLKQDGKVPPTPVTEADIKKYFDENRAQIPRMPATVALRQVVITPKPSAAAKALTRAKAESLLAEIRRGGNFEQIAKRESEDTQTKELGGDLGWLRRGGLVPEFERMMVYVPVGQVSPVFETTYGFHIIRVDRATPAEFKVRQILLRPKLDTADVLAAHSLADSVAAQWRAGSSYDSLVAKYHDPGEYKTIPEGIQRDQLAPPYQEAIKAKAKNDIVDAFAIPDPLHNASKFVVLQLTDVNDEHEATLADWHEQLRGNLSQERSMLRLFENLRKQTYVSVRL
ncbi:MAG: peptidylprolyl isomerase [Gemmatimonadaceae bacterium]